MRRIGKSDLRLVLMAPASHWMKVAIALAVAAGCVAWLPLYAVAPDAPPIAFGLVWLVVAAIVGVVAGVRLQNFVHGNGDDQEGLNR